MFFKKKNKTSLAVELAKFRSSLNDKELKKLETRLAEFEKSVQKRLGIVPSDGLDGLIYTFSTYDISAGSQVRTRKLSELTIQEQLDDLRKAVGLEYSDGAVELVKVSKPKEKTEADKPKRKYKKRKVTKETK